MTYPGRRAPASEPDWLTLGQAAKFLGVAQSTIRKWSDQGRVPAFYTPGGHRRYRRRDLEVFLERHDLAEVARALDVTVLLLHAEGDERVPVQQSRELIGLMRSPCSRLIAVPGGHHRSVQHDSELQAASLRFIERALAGR